MAYRKSNYGRKNYNRSYNRNTRSYYNARYGGFRGRAKYYGSRIKNNQAFRLNAPLTWLAGFVIGLTDFDNKIPALAKVTCANMPVTGKIGGRVRSVAQGMCLGDVFQKNVLPLLGIGSKTTSNTSSNGVKIL